MPEPNPEPKPALEPSPRERAKRSEGDRLALLALLRQREAAWNRGETRRRFPRIEEETAANPLFRGRNQVGAEPENLSSYLRDVGTGARPSRFDPQAFSAVLGALRAKAGWDTQLDVGQMSARWPEIVGENVARNVAVESFEEGVLTLRAASTSWKTQINALQAALLQTVEEHVGRGVVREIVVLGPPQRSCKRGPLSVPGRGPRDTYG